MLNLNKRSYLQENVASKRKKRLTRLIILLIILILLIGLPAWLIRSAVSEVSVHGKALASAYQNQNFGQIQKEVTNTKNSLLKANASLNILFWMRFIPLIGGYYGDIKSLTSAGVEELTAFEKVLADLKPYEEELGFTGRPIAGQDRVSQVIKILERVLPLLPKVEGNLKKAAGSVEDIDVDKYPENLGGVKAREAVTLARNFILGAGAVAGEARPVLEATPSLLGSNGSKTYLLLFQNDKEIRPTGGFLTAYANLKIDEGQITTTTSDDIYRLDEKLLNVCLSKICPLTPPRPIVKYLPEANGKPRSAWSMRDSNISPDVPTSAKEFERMYQLLGEGLPFDGIIFIDAQVVEELIEVTGPIEVLGTKYSSETDKRCNCPNVIYELESYAEIAAKGEKDRKAVLGVLMQQILAKSLGADTEKIPQLLDTIVRLANHKHVIFYMHDQKHQDALSKINWVGQIKSFDGDYLHINDSNFAGGKSNLYVEQTVTQEIKIEKDKIKKKITIEYKNPQGFNTWLNGINRDYVRFYVPLGSKLISSKGSEDAVTTIEEELGKTVFEAFITVRPQNSRKLEIEFESPYQPKDEYKLIIQKQPGAKDFQYIIKINGSKKADFKLDSDREFKFGI